MCIDTSNILWAILYCMCEKGKRRAEQMRTLEEAINRRWQQQPAGQAGKAVGLEAYEPGLAPISLCCPRRVH